MNSRIEIGELRAPVRSGAPRKSSRPITRVHNADTLPAPLEFFKQTLLQRQVLTDPNRDNSIRWKAGERLDRLFTQCGERLSDNLAVTTEDASYTYRELEARANQAARHLIEQGIKAGDRVGLLFDRTIETYVALLAVLKANAVYVPFDAGFPVERIRFILADAGIKTVVSMSAFEEKLREFDVRQIFLDAAKRDIDAKSDAALMKGEVALPIDQVCYIIYTSGTTGHPKGVVIEHPSICNFVRVAAELYGFAPGDRVYQGMTIAFDFSVEEVWVPLITGATLVPGRSGNSLVGEELADYLHDRRVTCLCCCPTLLATIERELPQLRILLVGGEACPQNLVARWHRAGRTILNSYGPTEATVTATLTELTPDKPVTIGVPLPSYSIVILDPAADRVMPRGEQGEIGIAGIGLAVGYLNRDELTQKKFIADFLNIPNNPSGRIYRTGDLGRINDDDEVEYHGRIDTQVKIRGYRIELVEIESVLMELPQVAQAAIATYEPEPGLTELVAYYAVKKGADGIARDEIVQALRARLPAYMVPAFLEELPFIPMLISNKADHKKLPKPKGSRVAVGKNIVTPRNEKERVIARALSEVLKAEHVSIEDHFFDDLGAHSLLMARFCAKLRQHPEMSAVSMRDIYLNPTVAKLADHLDHTYSINVVAIRQEPLHVPSDFAYYGCGALQLLFYTAYGLFGFWLLATGFGWTYAAIDNLLELYLRSVAFAVATFVGLSAVPIAAKWLLIGRWKAERIPIWSLRYFRFWLVKTLVQSAPMAAFVGSPIQNLYLRLLGARIGRNTVLNARSVPVATDLFSVGENTILRKDSILLGYTAQSNVIHTGSIRIGSNAFVGEASVLEIDTRMGDGAQLGHASSLQSGQRVPDGKRYHGTPAVETTADYCPIADVPCSSLRRWSYAALQLVTTFAVLVPAPVLLLVYWYPYFVQFTGDNYAHLETPTWAFSSLMLLVSAGLFLGALVTGLVGIYAVPRLCQLFLKPGRTYVLYGVHYWLQRTISAASNSQFYNLLFGDSSAIVNYMRFVGWRLNEVEQTGSNFGTNQRHDNPFLCEIGNYTMVSDGISMINMHMSSSSFRLGHTRIGECNYLGNDIHYPPDGRTGANCLLGTKVMIPIDGPVRENVGLLGSPPFEIPRVVARDKDLSATMDGADRKTRLRQKNSHNLVTALIFLATRWFFFFVALFVAHLAVLNYQHFGIFSLFAAGTFLSLSAILYFALIERASLGFRRLAPTTATIHEPYFWSHERHWKLSDSPIVSLFRGTPFKNVITRLLGVKVGCKVYDGGCNITDRTLTEIGDHANLNEGSILQAHSLEEGVFKSDGIRIGSGCTLGSAAFVHYGVRVGEQVVLDADSFLMKGEILDPHTVWRGNPAKLYYRHAVDVKKSGSIAPDKLAPWQELPEQLIPSEAAE